MIIIKTLKIKWTYKTKQYYINLGYKFTKINDIFEIKIEHLKKCSNVKIKVKCDICFKIKVLKLNDYNRSLKYGFYTCDKCSVIKLKQSCLSKYGVDNYAKTTEFKKRYEQIMFQKYGALNYSYTQTFKDKVKGKNNYFYIDGRHQFHEKRYIKEWRKSIYKKDNYTCQICSDNKGSNLVAHHIDGWNWCIAKRFDINNGITLCTTCHKNFHNIYGYGNNTQKQFYEYTNNKVQRLSL